MPIITRVSLPAKNYEKTLPSSIVSGVLTNVPPDTERFRGRYVLKKKKK